LTTQAARADDLPDPAQTYIESFGFQGQGCPAGSVSQNLSPDRQALTLIFSEFGVEGGAVVGSPQKAVACLINMSAHVPVGYSFSILRIDTRGYANIAAATTGYSRTAFRWGHSPVGLTQLSQQNIQGPYDNDFQASTTIPSQSLAWSPCTGSSQPLTIQSTVGVNGQHGYINVDSIDTSFVTQYRLMWRRCGDSGAGFPIGALATQGTVARDTSLCVNFRQGTIAVTTAAPPHPGSPFANLTHYATSVTGQSRNVSRSSANPNRVDIYQLPGDWNSILGLQPQISVTPAAAGSHPVGSVDQPASDSVCVRVAAGPANVAIRWNPRQP
jgi:hypothetical protein